MNYKDNKIKLIALFSYTLAETANGQLAVAWHLAACDQYGGGDFILINCCRFTAVKKGYVT